MFRRRFNVLGVADVCFGGVLMCLETIPDYLDIDCVVDVDHRRKHFAPIPSQGTFIVYCI